MGKGDTAGSLVDAEVSPYPVPRAVQVDQSSLPEGCPSYGVYFSTCNDNIVYCPWEVSVVVLKE